MAAPPVADAPVSSLAGTPARVEREHKLVIEVPSGLDVGAGTLAEWVRAYVGRALHRLVAARRLDSDYWVDPDTGDFAYVDFYLDDAAETLARQASSYRLRYRFKSESALRRHLRHPDWFGDWPFRVELQAKIGKRALAPGLSEVEESRFEFRVESPPFSVRYPPPPRPWPVSRYLPIAKVGVFDGLPTQPGFEVHRALRAGGGRPPLEAALALVTERVRFHLNAPTRFGSGPNPDQAFIVSFDASKVYDAQAVLQALATPGSGLPKPSGKFFEMEIEFERNTSERLDAAIAAASSVEERTRLEEVRGWFLADQAEILELAAERLAEAGVELRPVDGSKYDRARELR